MFRRNAVVLMAISLLLVGAAVASATTYTVTSFGTYSGTGTNLPRNYLAAGQAATGGDTVVGLDTTYNTYYWQGSSSADTSGTLLSVIKPSGYASNTFNAVSANGALAGGRADGAVYIPFVYSIPGTTSSGTLLTSYIGNGNTVNGINNAGDMVTNTSYYLLPSGTTYTYGTVPGGSSNTPAAMSNTGIVAGEYMPGGASANPVEWTPTLSGSTVTGWNSPTGIGAGNDGSVFAVNNSGEACGEYDWVGTDILMSPAAYKGNQSISFFPGQDYSGTSNPTAGEALGINDNGTVVGWDTWDNSGTSGLNSHGFIWVPSSPNATTGTTYDLNTYFASALTGAWAGDTIECGLGINDNGDVLALINAGGTNTVALISSPWAATPEPSALLLAASGLIGLLAYAWRKRK